MIVYKYVSCERIDILINKRIRFTQPDVLNDPFDIAPSFWKDEVIEVSSRVQSADLERNKKQYAASARMFLDRVHETRRDLGGRFAVLSLTGAYDNLLMWSHYADAHSGFVLGFDTENDFFRPGGRITLHGLQPVNYQDRRIYAPPVKGKLTEEELSRFASELLFTKSTEWEYEREYRLVADPTESTEVSVLSNGEHCYLFDLSPACIEQIVIGFRMTDEKRDCLLRILARDFQHTEIKLAVPDSRDFRLNFENLPT